MPGFRVAQKRGDFLVVQLSVFQCILPKLNNVITTWHQSLFVMQSALINI